MRVRNLVLVTALVTLAGVALLIASFALAHYRSDYCHNDFSSTATDGKCHTPIVLLYIGFVSAGFGFPVFFFSLLAFLARRRR